MDSNLWKQSHSELPFGKLGVNHITIRRGDGAADDTVLKDLQLPITYRKAS